LLKRKKEKDAKLKMSAETKNNKRDAIIEAVEGVRAVCNFFDLMVSAISVVGWSVLSADHDAMKFLIFVLLYGAGIFTRFIIYYDFSSAKNWESRSRELFIGGIVLLICVLVEGIWLSLFPYHLTSYCNDPNTSNSLALVRLFVYLATQTFFYFIQSGLAHIQATVMQDGDQ